MIKASLINNKTKNDRISKEIRKKALDLLKLLKEDIEDIQNKEIKQTEEQLEEYKRFVESRRRYWSRFSNIN